MARETERKFLLTGDDWRNAAHSSEHIRQGYLALGPPVSVRIRVTGPRATLNIKESTLEIGRAEFEYDIPLHDANELLDRFCQNRLIEKTRHKVQYAGKTWEIDEFHGQNAPLILAEIELHSPDEPFQRPPWLAQEVSNDPRYHNSNLLDRPFREWGNQG